MLYVLWIDVFCVHKHGFLMLGHIYPVVSFDLSCKSNIHTHTYISFHTLYIRPLLALQDYTPHAKAFGNY